MPHKLIIETVSPAERATVFERCTNAKEAGIVEEFHYYTDHSRGRRVYEITYADRPPVEQVYED